MPSTLWNILTSNKYDVKSYAITLDRFIEFCEKVRALQSRNRISELVSSWCKRLMIVPLLFQGRDGLSLWMWWLLPAFVFSVLLIINSPFFSMLLKTFAAACQSFISFWCCRFCQCCSAFLWKRCAFELSCKHSWWVCIYCFLFCTPDSISEATYVFVLYCMPLCVIIIVIDIFLTAIPVLLRLMPSGSFIIFTTVHPTFCVIGMVINTSRLHFYTFPSFIRLESRCLLRSPFWTF